LEKLIEKISSNPDEYNGRQLQMCEFGLEGISDFKFNHQNNTFEVQSDRNWKGVLHIEYSKDKGLKVS
jgi:hypothetical protein